MLLILATLAAFALTAAKTRWTRRRKAPSDDATSSVD